MRILILADSNWRDGLGIAFLKRELQQLIDADIVVASFDICFPVVENFKPHAVILNHVIGKRNRRVANYVKRQGGLVIVVPTEGRANSQEQLEWLAKQNDDPFFCDLFLSWNQITADEFQRVDTAVVGCPRFDVYQDCWYEMDMPESIFYDKYGLDPEKPTIAFASSFPQAKFTYHNKRFAVEDWKDLEVTEIEGREDPVAFAQAEYRALRKFQFWVQAIYNEYGDDYNIIVKPHPLEDVDEWQKLCDGLNIPLLDAEYIFNMVANSDLLIARAGCVTHQDAWLAGCDSIHAVMGNESMNGATLESLQYGFATASHHIELLDRVHDYFSTDKKFSYDCYDFLDKWGFSAPDSAYECATAIVDFIQGRSPEAEDISTEALINVNKQISDHNNQNRLYRFDNLGHFGKAVTKDIVDSWSRKIELVI